MMTPNIHYQTASELIAALANKKISSAELLEISIARIEALDKKINAVVVRDFDNARKVALAADAEIARGEHRPLLGLPITVKESFSVSSLTTSWGNPTYKNLLPQNESLVVKRLKAAGAIILGKTNVPFMLRDWQCFNDIYGVTNNPWDLTRTPGGSSGGSAAALTAGYVSLELGSDTAGSLRAPAHFCGVYAHKPSLDLVPIRNAGPPPFDEIPGYRGDFSVIGPMARSVNDLILSLNIVAGPDEIWEGKAYRLNLPKPRIKKLKDFRVLIIDAHPLYPTAREIRDSLHRLSEELIKHGVSVSYSHEALPDLGNIARTYITLLAALMTVDVPPEVLQSMLADRQTIAADDNSLHASLIRGCALSQREWVFATRTRLQLRKAWCKLYQDFDVILCPNMPTLAFPHNFEKNKLEIDNAIVPYGEQYIWPSIATLFNLPSTAIPIAQSQQGLPIGIQIIGNYLEDYTTLAFAHLLEQEFGGFVAPKL